MISGVVALKKGLTITLYHVFLSGPGGVGKSHVIKMIQSDTIRFLKLSGAFEPEDVVVLLTALTGVTAFNINGMILHSALQLTCNRSGTSQPLNSNTLNTLRTRLSKVALLVIDEISMVGSNMLLSVHKRLQQIKGASPQCLFGNTSILAVGDLYQLPPVKKHALYDSF